MSIKFTPVRGFTLTEAAPAAPLDFLSLNPFASSLNLDPQLFDVRQVLTTPAAAPPPQPGPDEGQQRKDDDQDSGFFVVTGDSDEGSDMEVSQGEGGGAPGSQAQGGAAPDGAAAAGDAAAAAAAPAPDADDDAAVFDADFLLMEASPEAEDGAEAAPKLDRTTATGRQFGYQPPWMRKLGVSTSPMLRLHNEIVTFARMLEPTEEEAAVRRQAVADVSAEVHRIWPAAEVQLFGSFATGLYVPTSDIDLVVVNSGCHNILKGLQALGAALTQRGLVRNLQVIGSARVPIIKFEMAASGIAFDVSFDVANGPHAAEAVKALIAEWPPMKALVLVLKVFLHQRDLNEVYSGGIGSYALIIIVAAFLRLHPSRRPTGDDGGVSEGGARTLEGNLGVLLVDFFRLYGREINLTATGVSCDGFFAKGDRRGWLNPERPWLLAVQDPHDVDNDVARNSYNVRVVRSAFDHAYQMLTAPSGARDSLLARIIHLQPVVAGRELPRWPPPPPPASAGRTLSKKERKQLRNQRQAEERRLEAEKGKGRAAKASPPPAAAGKRKASPSAASVGQRKASPSAASAGKRKPATATPPPPSTRVERQGSAAGSAAGAARERPGSAGRSGGGSDPQRSASRALDDRFDFRAASPASADTPDSAGVGGDGGEHERRRHRSRSRGSRQRSADDDDFRRPVGGGDERRRRPPPRHESGRDADAGREAERRGHKRRRESPEREAAAAPAKQRPPPRRPRRQVGSEGHGVDGRGRERGGREGGSGVQQRRHDAAWNQRRSGSSGGGHIRFESD